MRRSAVILAIVLAASTAHAQTSGYRVARKPRMALVLTGAGLLVSGFIASLIGAIGDSFEGQSPVMLVPVVGPWLAFGWDMANPHKCPLDVPTSGCSSLAVDPALVALGLVEVTGAAFLGIGAVPHEVRTQVTITPTFGYRQVGLLLRF